MVVISPTETSNDTTALQAAINANDDVELAAGGVFNIPSSLDLKPSTRIFTDPDNPATLKRTGALARTAIVNGSGVRLENIQFDWNFGGTWQSFRSHIALSPPSGSGITASGSYSGLRVVGCRFIESTTPGTHNGNDCWCISMTPGVLTVDIEDVKILGCYSDSTVQLCSGGSLNGTWSNVEIAYNNVRNGWNAGIAMSSLARTELDYETTFENLDVHHNILRNFRGIGMFFGQDNGVPQDGAVHVDNLKINDNHIVAGIVSDFPTCVLIRPGTETGYQASAEVNRNFFDIADSRRIGKSPRLVNMQGNQAGNTLTFIGNKKNGLGEFSTTNITVTSSGNSNLDGSSWSP